VTPVEPPGKAGKAWKTHGRAGKAEENERAKEREGA